MSVAELIKQVKALPAREREKLFLAILALQSLYFFRLVAFLDLVRNRSGLGGVLRWVLQCLKPCAIVGGPANRTSTMNGGAAAFEFLRAEDPRDPVRRSR